MNEVPGGTETSRRSLLQSRGVVVAASVLLLVLLALALLIVYQDAGIVRQQINEDYNRQQLVLARRAAADINARLTDLVLDIQEVAWVIGHGSGGAQTDSAIARAMVRFHSQGLETLEVVKSADAACSVQIPSDLKVVSVQFEQDVSGSPAFISTICRPVFPRDGSGGVLAAKINVSQLLASVMKDVRPGRTGYGWVINEEGAFLFHPDTGLIGQSAFAKGAADERGTGYAGTIQVTRNQMISGQAGTGSYISGWHGGDETEPPKLLAFAPVISDILPPGAVWSVAVTTPVPEVAASVHNVEVRHILAEAAIIGGIFLFGLLLMLYQLRLSRSLREEVTGKEKFLSSILRNSVDAIIFIDNDNRVRVWNRGAELTFGYTADEMLGQTFHRLIPPDMDADGELGQITDEVRRRGYIRNYRTQRMTKAGKRITIDLSRTMVLSEDSKSLGSTAIIKDITEKEEMDKLIYNTEKLASIGTLAAGVAHEINNPLTVILGFTDLLREKFKEGTPEYDDLMIIEENANTARRIVEDMLGFARITEGLEDTVDVKHAIERVMSIVEVTLKQENIDMEVDVPDGLPPVRGDSREFQQVVFNLINNAMAAMGQTGGVLTIKAASYDGAVKVTVADTGTGIPDKIKGQVFDPFFTTKGVGEGTGLGLSLCYGIVRKYGGNIEFTSVSREDHPDEASGSVFTVFMPVANEAKPL